MNDQELFELCKEVYKRKPGWDTTEKCYAYIDQFGEGVHFWHVIPLHEDNVDDVDEWHPLYTSDYLLEKLPPTIVSRGVGFSTATRIAMTSKQLVGTESDTPLKALLKLVVALDDAGELPR